MKNVSRDKLKKWAHWLDRLISHNPHAGLSEIAVYVREQADNAVVQQDIKILVESGTRFLAEFEAALPEINKAVCGRTHKSLKVSSQTFASSLARVADKLQTSNSRMAK